MIWEVWTFHPLKLVRMIVGVYRLLLQTPTKSLSLSTYILPSFIVIILGSIYPHPAINSLLFSSLNKILSMFVKLWLRASVSRWVTSPAVLYLQQQQKQKQQPPFYTKASHECCTESLDPDLLKLVLTLHHKYHSFHCHCFKLSQMMIPNIPRDLTASQHCDSGVTLRLQSTKCNPLLSFHCAAAAAAAAVQLKISTFFGAKHSRKSRISASEARALLVGSYFLPSQIIFADICYQLLRFRLL